MYPRQARRPTPTSERSARRVGDRARLRAVALALLALEPRDRQLERLGHRGIESSEQLERAQQLDHRGHLHRLAALGALHGRLPDARLISQLGLGPVALEAMAREPAAKLGEDGRVGCELV
jgi:hypothetical protein